ncbi:hypothetical protein HYC85_016539 [Camellia sinensis]|uniref:Increased DNA methylation 1 C-terminal domain-containing protein n=1 Tax=Camellia sinensis TaxID=4442 RepID=A0A7J7H279_CAMSI|nr:hypothetical protein HYC85_016539 [Camellia sinensis]
MYTFGRPPIFGGRPESLHQVQCRYTLIFPLDFVSGGLHFGGKTAAPALLHNSTPRPSCIEKRDGWHEDRGMHTFVKIHCHALFLLSVAANQESTVFRDLACFPRNHRKKRLIGASSNNTQTNFRGLYSTILEKDDEIISMAFDSCDKLAEMPFIATCESYRSQGMCQRLMVATESNRIRLMCSAWTGESCGLSPHSFFLEQILIDFISMAGFLLPQSCKHGHTLHSRENRNMNRKIWFSAHWTLTKQRNKALKTLAFHDSWRLQKILAVPQGSLFLLQNVHVKGSKLINITIK